MPISDEQRAWIEANDPWGFEACQGCDRGLGYLLVNTGQVLCGNCVDALIRRRGWDDPAWVQQQIAASAAWYEAWLAEQERRMPRRVKRETSKRVPPPAEMGPGLWEQT